MGEVWSTPSHPSPSHDHSHVPAPLERHFSWWWFSLLQCLGAPERMKRNVLGSSWMFLDVLGMWGDLSTWVEKDRMKQNQTGPKTKILSEKVSDRLRSSFKGLKRLQWISEILLRFPVQAPGKEWIEISFLYFTSIDFRIHLDPETSWDVKNRWGLQLRVCCYDAVMPCRTPSLNSSLEASRKTISRSDQEKNCRGHAVLCVKDPLLVHLQHAEWNFFIQLVNVGYAGTLEYVGTCWNTHLCQLFLHVSTIFNPSLWSIFSWSWWRQFGLIGCNGSTFCSSKICRMFHQKCKVQSQPESQAPGFALVLQCVSAGLLNTHSAKSALIEPWMIRLHSWMSPPSGIGSHRNNLSLSLSLPFSLSLYVYIYNMYIYIYKIHCTHMYIYTCNHIRMYTIYIYIIGIGIINVYIYIYIHL